jgi:hypothetical protein
MEHLRSPLTLPLSPKGRGREWGISFINIRRKF